MFCTNCGKKLPNGTKFCSGCGTPTIQKPAEPVAPPDTTTERPKETLAPISAPESIAKPTTQPVPESPASEPVAPPSQHKVSLEPMVSDNAEASKSEVASEKGQADTLEVVVRENISYYVQEFQKAGSGEKTKFNWAAFFFSAFFCLYRKCGELFKKYFLIPIVITLVAIILTTIGTSQFSLVLMSIGGIASFAGSVWAFVNCIRLGKNFNMAYYRHCQNTLATGNGKKYGTSIGAPILLFVGISIVSILIAFISVLSMLGGLPNEPAEQPSEILDNGQITDNKEPLSPGLTNESKEILRQVLLNETRFVNRENDNCETFINQITYLNGTAVGTMTFMPTRFAIVDMDQDGTEEIVVELEDNMDAYRLVLRSFAGSVFGYGYGYRSMSTLYTDGSFDWSSSAFESGYAHLTFTDKTATMEDITGNEHSTEAIEWYEFTTDNINHTMNGNFITDSPADIDSPYNQQEICVVSSGSTATLTLRHWEDGAWSEVLSADAYIGSNGTSYNKTEGDRCTPAGTFDVLFAFGTESADTGLSFVPIYNGDVWVCDPGSMYYNTLQNSSSYDKDWTSSENIYSKFTKGSSVACICFAFNGDGCSPYTAMENGGSALFIDGVGASGNLTSGYGDIKLSATDMALLLQNLDSTKRPVITIS